MFYLNESKFSTYTKACICSFFILLLFLVLNHEIYLPIGQNISDYSSDGIKNLYTFGYFLKYNQGIDFTGLLYPFSEHVIYMDAQPFWVWIIQGLENFFDFHIENPIVYIHLILLFNLWMGSFFTYLILNHFNRNSLFNGIACIIILLMSPQIFRFASHFALGNIAIIPMFWWWYICLSEKKSWIGSFFFIASLTLTGYIHPYLLLMVAFFLLSYEVVGFIIHRKIKLLQWIVTGLPIVLFQLSIKLTDHTEDRPTSAWGAKEFACRIHDLLLPLDGFLKETWSKLIPGLSNSYTEGHGYVTAFGILVILLLLYNTVKNIISRKFTFIIEERSIEHWLLASIPVLMFAFFIPFKWNSMAWMLDILTPLKQFRGTGRFVLIFYYAFTVYCVIYLSRFLQRSYYWAPLLIAICFCMTLYDIYQNSAVLKRDYRNYGKRDAYQYFKTQADLLFSKVDNIEDYQCIIPYPISTEGTEVMWLNADWNAKIHYFWYSYFYQLPLATAHSSRVSFSHNMDILQLSGHQNSPKPILKKLDPNKKCLVIALDKHQYEQIPLIKNAQWINTFENIALYSIGVEELKGIYKNQRENDWVDTITHKIIKYEPFDNLSSGSLHLIDQNRGVEIMKFTNPNPTKDKTVRVLFWYIPNFEKENTIPIISAYDITGEVKTFFKDWRENSTQSYNYRDKWFCVDYSLTIPKKVKEIQLEIAAKGILVDDFTIYDIVSQP